MPDHKPVWEKWCDRYYLQLLSLSLNWLPSPKKSYEAMNEADVNAWIRSIDFEHMTAQDNCHIKVPPVSEFCKNMQSVKKTEVINLPLSLEDNSTLTGTAAIFEEFSKEFKIPSDESSAYLEFDNAKKKFDVKTARERYVFIKSLEKHRVFMTEMERQILTTEKDIENVEVQLDDMQSSASDESDTDELPVHSTLQTVPDDDFKSLFTKLDAATKEVTQSSDETSLDRLIEEVSVMTKKIHNTLDQFGRTVFHAAVEERNYTLTKVLISSGINPNAKEGCGLTPLSLAVFNSDPIMCELLITNFAEFRGEMFSDVPSPLEIAEAMEAQHIVELFKAYSNHLDCSIVTFMQTRGTNDQTLHEMRDVATCTPDGPTGFVYRRSSCEKFPTAVVGDVGTCKNNRSVRNRNSAAYGWSTEVPGDMHTKGFLCEAVFKAHGTGGFHKVVNSVMKRPKLTKDAFKKRKFQEQNLSRIQESVRDGSHAYGMAAVEEFRKSSDFPCDDELRLNLQRFGDHNEILLKKFKKWLSESAKLSEKHKYHQQLFTLFGPLLELFITARRNGDGHLREIVWVILLPIFAQLGFKNYWTEAFVHVVNFAALWPLALRKMIKSNSTVNLTGRAGHNIDLDEYVETYIVRPLKVYATGKYLCLKV